MPALVAVPGFSGDGKLKALFLRLEYVSGSGPATLLVNYTTDGAPAALQVNMPNGVSGVFDAFALAPVDAAAIEYQVTSSGSPTVNLTIQFETIEQPAPLVVSIPGAEVV